jgi:hypothetical protein
MSRLNRLNEDSIVRERTLPTLMLLSSLDNNLWYPFFAIPNPFLDEFFFVNSHL